MIKQLHINPQVRTITGSTIELVTSPSYIPFPSPTPLPMLFFSMLMPLPWNSCTWNCWVKQALISAQAPGRQGIENSSTKTLKMGTKTFVRKGPAPAETIQQLLRAKTLVGTESLPPFTFQEVQVHQKGSVDLSAVRHIQ